MLLTEYTNWKHADQPKPAINHNSQQLRSQTALHSRAQTNLNSLPERMNLWSWAMVDCAQSYISSASFSSWWLLKLDLMIDNYGW